MAATVSHQSYMYRGVSFGLTYTEVKSATLNHIFSNEDYRYIVSSFTDLETPNTRDHHGVGPRAPAFFQPPDQFRKINL